MSLIRLAALASILLSGVAHAGLKVPDVGSLPSAPSTPYLWFDGGDPTVIAALQARVSHARTSSYYSAFKSYVDARLATVAGADDDTCSKVVKAAALLHLLGLTPPANTPDYKTYRAVAVAAFLGVGTREAIDSVGELIVAPSNAIDILQDSSRLQSLAEGYDLLRGSGTTEDERKEMQAILVNWSEALAHDWNLTGAAGIPGHRDNWGIKGGSALVTAALALPDNALAGAWLATGMTFLNESLDVTASTTGWYGESVWYLNYSLANLFPTAWHVQQATGVDWFPTLRPMVLASLAWRQPDGSAPPFEEGLTNTFPWNVLAAAYPDLAPTMLWAWDHSPKNDENFENQQIHDVTRFIVADLTSQAAAPSAPVMRSLPNDAHLLALRSGWSDGALQVTSLTARDYSTSELNASRHNMRNPLDLVLHGAGILAVPTASGGPTVTSSANRGTYLSVLAKNIPLVGRQAPFVVAASNVVFGDRVDSEDEGARANHYVDVGRTVLGSVYSDTREVSRLVAMIDRSYVVVLDRFAAQSSKLYELSWRGRGTRSTRANTTSLQGYSWAGLVQGSPRLDLDVVGTGVLGASANSSLYAPGWNQEEAIDGVLVGTAASTAGFVSVLQVGASNAAARSVASVGSGSVAAAAIVSGETKDTVLLNTGNGDVAADGVTSDGVAAMVRRTGGVVAGMALVQGRKLEVGSVKVGATAALTLALTPASDGLVVELSGDRSASVDLVLEGLPGIKADLAYQARLEGVSVGVSQNGTRLSFAALSTGTLVVEERPCLAGSGADPDGDHYCGDGDNCPSVSNPDQADGNGDGVGDACECLDGAVRCNDGNPCTTDSCVVTSGACLNTQSAGSCDDHDACTLEDRCAGGSCTGSPRSCDDINACTNDSCNPASGCAHTPRNGEPCTDGSLCTSGDHCSGTSCVGSALVCDDDDPCTADVCNPASGCATTPLGGVACDDQDRCTGDDFCVAGECGGAMVDCDDGNPCTDDVCDAALGCQHPAGSEGDPCNDGNACTSGDLCAAGKCTGVGLQCDDGNPCTTDGCVIGSGCMSTAVPAGVPCDDGDGCSDGDHCQAGICVGGAVDCDDADPCTEQDRCDLEAGCIADAIECPEGSVCEGGECHEVVVEPDAEVEVGPEEVEEVEGGPEEVGEDEGGGEGEVVDEGEGEGEGEVVDEGGGEGEGEGEGEVVDEGGGEGEVVDAGEDVDDAGDVAESESEADAGAEVEGVEGAETLDLGGADVQVIRGHDEGCAGADVGGIAGVLGLAVLWLGRRRLGSRIL